MIWGITFEAFKENPLLGIGADNFITDYGKARESYSNLDAENNKLEFGEILLPERSHNEYLQILAELGIVGIFLFGWLLLGIGRCAVLFNRKRISLLTIVSLAGIAAFLISSIASSYSFRVPANGVCFFFLLALAADGLPKMKKNLHQVQQRRFEFLKYQPAIIGGALIICSVTLVFSTVRALSLMYFQKAISSAEMTETERNVQKAITLDSREPSFRYFYGVQLST